MGHRVALLACVFLAAAWSSARAGGIEEETTETTYAVGPHPTLRVRNTDGRIFVYGSEAGAIRVKAYKRAFTKERLRQIRADVVVEGDVMTIDTVYPPAPKGLFDDRSGTVEYTILVPQNATIEKLELLRGEVRVNDLRGSAINLQLSRGIVSVHNCFAPTQVSLGSGGVDISYDWWEQPPFSLAANVGEGDITLSVPLTAALRVDAATQSGHVRNYRSPDESRREDVQTLQTDLGPASGVQFTLRTGKGNIKLSKPY